MKEKGLMVSVLGLIFVYLTVGLEKVEPCYSISP
jgi:hypothetical protein